MLKPKIGIRPVIDGRWGGVRESLEEKTMNMAKAAAERIIARVKGLDKGPGRLSIISGNLIDGESVRALI